MELKSRGVWIKTILFIFFQLLANENVHCLGVVGQRAPCGNEGDTIAVDKIDKNKCFTCICKNGFVECYKYPTCPKTEGCHLLMLGDRKCKGCWFRGAYHESSTEWTDSTSNCRVLRCEAGVVTDSHMQCHVPCDNPIPPAAGQCCPTCPDCRINGQIATDDRDVTSDDPCLKCRCTHGRMTCSKKACPVLQCTKLDQKQQAPGECCPKCVGERSLTPVPQTCVLGLTLYGEGDVLSYDMCTRCKCMNQTSICERQSCPVLDCAPDLQKKKLDSCCKECSIPEFYELKSQCIISGKTYEEGQSWRMDACSSCKCHRGMPSCAKTRCNVTIPCPPGTHLVHNPSECCQKCEESEGVCMVFGDPHYKTFDGKIYSFQGIGKYQLASDCQNHSFSIRVTNDFGTDTHTSTLTKRVRIKFGEIRLNLGQKFRTTIDGTRVNIPFKNNRLRIEKNEYNIHITLNNNVKILWNGHNFLEIVVPSKYKNKLCGLCGNFNSNVQDDLKLRKGPIVTDSNIMKFGNSWCLGKDCIRQAKRTALIRPCKMRPHKRPGKNPCKYLSSTELFNGCDSKLNYDKYYHACLKDMCDCPNGKCYCASLMAYSQECTRLGVNVTNWEKNSYCTDDTVKSNIKNKHSKGLPFTKAEIARITKKFNNSHNHRGIEPIIH